MNRPNRAPLYACIYHSLCDVARQHGYALAIHGTLNNDCDFIAVPWTDDAAEDVVLVQALKERLGAVYLHEELAKVHNAGCRIDMSDVDAAVNFAIDEAKRQGDKDPFECVQATLVQLRRQASTPEKPYNAILSREKSDPTPKPHGRKAWNLHLDHGAKIDLSVMPRTEKKP